MSALGLCSDGLLFAKMSELTALTKRGGELQEWLAAASVSASSSSSRECQARLEELETDLLPRVGKLAVKSTQVDAVTQQPRFGPQTCSKICLLAEQLKALVVPVANLRDVTSAREGVEQEALARAQAEAQAQALAQALAQAQAEQAQAEATKHPPPPSDADEVEARLQEEADLLRQNRAAAKKELQELLHVLNGIRVRSANNSIESFVAAFRQLPKASQQFISKLLSNICAHPNDEKLRRIRLNHPVIVEHISQFVSGIDAFMTMGWEAYLEAAPENGGGKPAPVASAGPHSLFYLCSVSRHSVVLTLTEPPVDDGDNGTATWVRWFDDLSAYVASIS